MSLVAYGSSDDSDQSDNETTPVNINRTETGKTATAAVSSSSQLDSQFSDSDSELVERQETDDNGRGSLDHMLKELPSPKAVSDMVLEETDVLEDEVKPKPSQVADIVKPVPKKQRQTVKITIPALPDSDEDDDGPARKRPRPGAASGKSGLTSILPAPMHAAKKETGRILLPYSLTKKSQPTVTSKNSITSQSQKPVTSLAADYSSDSEEEAGEPVSFFSLDSSTGRKIDSSIDSTNITMDTSHKFKEVTDNKNDGVPTVPLPPAGLRTSLNLPAPHRTAVIDSDLSVASDISSRPLVGPLMPIVHTGDPDAPLTFKGGVTSQRRLSNNAVSSSSSGISASEMDTDQNIYYNMPYDESMQYPECSDVGGFQQDQEFLRLQGKKMQGKEEINLIDVNADDFTDPSEITKHLTEEQTYQSHRKKDKEITGQQKRKHQITYLAFQAKERELELKNQWSQNRQTKKQTQAKYGF